MKRLQFVLILFFLQSCSGDHRKEAISNYAKYIWRVKSDDRYELLTLIERGTITGKDSLDILVKQYSQGEREVPTPDSLIAAYEKDEIYNSNLLEKTKVKIDSFKKIPIDNSFYLDYIKSLEQLRDFTASTLREMRAEKYMLNKYKNDPDEILCYRVFCRYRIKKEPPDTTSKRVSQIFYLSKDTRRVLAVRQDSAAIKKPGP